jgi:hypothetical protein
MTKKTVVIIQHAHQVCIHCLSTIKSTYISKLNNSIHSDMSFLANNTHAQTHTSVKGVTALCLLDVVVQQ